MRMSLARIGSVADILRQIAQRATPTAGPSPAPSASALTAGQGGGLPVIGVNTGLVGAADILLLAGLALRVGARAGRGCARGASQRRRLRADTDELVARIEGDESVVLSTRTGGEAGRDLHRRIVHALAEHRVPASVGLSGPRSPSLLDAWAEADDQMHQAKRGRPPAELRAPATPWPATGPPALSTQDGSALRLMPLAAQRRNAH